MKKLVIGGVAAIAIAAVIVACGGGGGNDSFDVTHGVVIQNASIVNTRDGSILFAKSIVLDGGNAACANPEPWRIATITELIDPGPAKAEIRAAQHR